MRSVLALKKKQSNARYKPPLSSRDAEEKYGLAKGHGRDYVETDFPRQSVKNEYNPRTRTYEIAIRNKVPLVRPTFHRRKR